MKKYILIWMITVTACLVFADGKKELKFIVDNVDSKVFQEAEVRIDKLQGQAEKYSSQGKYDKALEYYHKSLVEAKRLYGENSTAAASIYTGMALPYIKMDKKLKAADSLFTASQIYKKSGGGMLRPRASRFLLMHAGYLYYDSNYTRKACKILEQAEQQDIPMFSSAEKEKRLAEFYRYLALACFKEEKYKEAIPYFQKSLLLEYKRTEPDNKELGVINLFIGNALLETNKLKESLLYLQKAEKSFESCKINANYQYKLFFSLSTVCKYLNKKDKHLYYSQKLNNICMTFKKNDFRKIIGLVCLADAMSLVGQKKDATELMEQAIKLAKKQEEAPKTILRLKKLLQDIKLPIK